MVDKIQIFPQNESTARLTIPVNKGSKRVRELMKDDYIQVNFSTLEPIYFKLGDYCDIPELGRFVLTKEHRPKYNSRTAGYDYELQFDAQYVKWKNKLMRFRPLFGGAECTFNLMTTAEAHLKTVVDNLEALWSKEGYESFKYFNIQTGAYEPWEYVVLSDVTNGIKNISYDKTSIYDALARIAEEFETEWWVEGNVIYLGKCRIEEEDKLPYKLSLDTNLSELSSSDSQSDYVTRIIPFGSDKNISPRYRKELIFDVKALDSYQDPSANGTGTEYWVISDTTRVLYSDMFKSNSKSYDPSMMNGGDEFHRNGYDIQFPNNKSVTSHSPASIKAYTQEYKIKCGVLEKDAIIDFSRFTPSFTASIYEGQGSFSQIRMEVLVTGVYNEPGSKIDPITRRWEQKFDSNSSGHGNGCKFTFPSEELNIVGTNITLTLVVNLWIDFNTTAYSYVAINRGVGESVINIYQSHGTIYQSVSGLTLDFVDERGNSLCNTGNGVIWNKLFGKNLSERNKFFIPKSAIKNGFEISEGVRFKVVDGLYLPRVKSSYFTDLGAKVNESEDLNTNGIVTRRLMPPADGKSYVDLGNSEETPLSEAVVESVVVFDDVYPKAEMEVTKVKTYKAKDEIPNDDGTKTTIEYDAFVLEDNIFTGEYGVEGGKMWYAEYQLPDKDIELVFKEPARYTKGEEEAGIIPVGKKVGDLKNPKGGKLVGQTFTAKWRKEGPRGWEIIRDNNTYIPNDFFCPCEHDVFMLTGIDVAAIDEVFVDKAEKELLNVTQEYVNRMNMDKTVYNCTLRVGASNDVPFRLGTRVNLQYDGSIYAKDGRTSRIMGYEFPLDFPEDNPKLKIGEEPQYTRFGAVEGNIDAMKYALNAVILNSAGGSGSLGVSESDIKQIVAREGDKLFLSKAADDSTDHTLKIANAKAETLSADKADVDALTILDKVKFGKDFISGGGGPMGLGGYIDSDGRAELESLTLRSFLEVPELRYNRVEVSTGISWDAPGSGKIERAYIETKTDGEGVIISTTPKFMLKLEDGELGTFHVGDICMGIWHFGDGDATSDSDDGKGGFTVSGFTTIYFEVTNVEGDKNQFVSYKLRESDANWTPNDKHPQAGMSIVAYGNKTNESRQRSVYRTRSYMRYLNNVNDYVLNSNNIAAQFGDLSNLDVFGLEMTGYSVYLNNIYMSGTIHNVSIEPTYTITPSLTSIRCDSSGTPTNNGVLRADFYAITPSGSRKLTETDVDYNHKATYHYADNTVVEGSVVTVDNPIAIKLDKSGLTSVQITLLKHKGNNEYDELVSVSVPCVSDGASGSIVTISKTTVKYAVSTDGKTAPADESIWVETIPDTSQGQYLWVRTTISYSDGKSSTTYSVSRNGLNGDAIAGTSVYVDKTEIKYAITSNATQPTDASVWKNSIGELGTLGKKSWLWTRTYVLYSDTNSTTSYSVAYIGGDGEQGVQGGIGPKGEAEYIHLAYCKEVEAKDGKPAYDGFSLTVFDEARYIGIYKDSIERDSEDRTKYAWSKFKGEDGKDGTKLTSTLVEYCKSTSGTVIPQEGWGTTIPELGKGEWLWTRVSTTYSEGEPSVAYSVSRNGSDGVSITSVETRYKVTPTQTKPEVDAFTETDFSKLTLTKSHWLWTQTRTTYSDNKITYSYSVSYIGEDGKKGDPGVPGVNGTSTYIHFAYCADIVGPKDDPDSYVSFSLTLQDDVVYKYVGMCVTEEEADPEEPTLYTWSQFKGEDGTTVESVKVEYCVGYSGTQVPQFVIWSSNMPSSYPSGSWLWTRVTTKYSNGETSVAYSVSRNGINGTGVSIDLAETLYATTTEPIQPLESASEWSAEVPEVDKGLWLWTRTHIVYDDGTETNSYSVSYIGYDGANGDRGPAGANGESSYMHIAYGKSIQGNLPNPTRVEGFSTTWVEGAEYIGICKDSNVSDPDDFGAYTWSRLKGEQGDPGQKGGKGDKGDAGTNYTENLLLNSNFSKGFDKWTDRNGYNRAPDVHEITTSNGKQWVHLKTNTQTDYQSISQIFKVKGGCRYTFSCLAMARTANARMDVELVWRDSQDNQISPNTPYKFEGIGLLDEKYSFGFTAPANATSVLLGIGKFGALNLVTDIEFTDLKVEEGVNPSPVWSPNPSEMQGKDGKDGKDGEYIKRKYRLWDNSLMPMTWNGNHDEPLGDWQDTAPNATSTHRVEMTECVFVGNSRKIIGTLGNQPVYAKWSAPSRISSVGVDGAIIVTSDWSNASKAYRDGTTPDANSGGLYVVDVVKYRDNYYRCIKSHSSSNAILPTNTTHWKVMSKIDALYTSMLITPQARIDFLNGQEIALGDSNGVYARIGSPTSNDMGDGRNILWMGGSDERSSTLCIDKSGKITSREILESEDRTPYVGRRVELNSALMSMFDKNGVQRATFSGNFYGNILDALPKPNITKVGDWQKSYIEKGKSATKTAMPPDPKDLIKFTIPCKAEVRIPIEITAKAVGIGSGSTTGTTDNVGGGSTSGGSTSGGSTSSGSTSGGSGGMVLDLTKPGMINLPTNLKDLVGTTEDTTTGSFAGIYDISASPGTYEGPAQATIVMVLVDADGNPVPDPKNSGYSLYAVTAHADGSTTTEATASVENWFTLPAGSYSLRLQEVTLKTPTNGYARVGWDITNIFIDISAQKAEFFANGAIWATGPTNYATIYQQSGDGDNMVFEILNKNGYGFSVDCDGIYKHTPEDGWVAI